MTTPRLPFGKWKFLPLEEVPGEYLEWVLGVLDSRNPDLVKAVADELRLRHWTQNDTRTGLVDCAMATKIITVGRRTLAQAYHPDKGGNHKDMVAVNHTADVLLEKIKVLIA